jgi:flagellar basal-body rod protein FlgB
MAFSFEKALGIHPQALEVRSQRMQLLASNLANSDTPHYKARDIDFRKALGAAQETPSAGVARTHRTHLPISGIGSPLEPQFRVPIQPSLDGNTVDPHLENAAFMENAIQYQASLDFLSARLRSLRSAIKGE